MSKAIYEIVPARKYYGPIGSVGQQRPFTDSVLLRNGYPEFNGTAREVKKFLQTILKRSNLCHRKTKMMEG